MAEATEFRLSEADASSPMEVAPVVHRKDFLAPVRLASDPRAIPELPADLSVPFSPRVLVADGVAAVEAVPAVGSWLPVRDSD